MQYNMTGRRSVGCALGVPRVLLVGPFVCVHSLFLCFLLLVLRLFGLLRGRRRCVVRPCRHVHRVEGFEKRHEADDFDLRSYKNFCW